mmetsp:Transcript_46174/g.100552  ORF Transcript_46174/g.100552 Transcript_46174/m.100552 type:complete len:300 (+) Transcript_46174:151-1050(+)
MRASRCPGCCFPWLPRLGCHIGADPRIRKSLDLPTTILGPSLQVRQLAFTQPSSITLQPFPVLFPLLPFLSSVAGGWATQRFALLQIVPLPPFEVVSTTSFGLFLLLPSTLTFMAVGHRHVCPTLLPSLVPGVPGVPGVLLRALTLILPPTLILQAPGRLPLLLLSLPLRLPSLVFPPLLLEPFGLPLLSRFLFLSGFLHFLFCLCICLILLFSSISLGEDVFMQLLRLVITAGIHKEPCGVRLDRRGVGPACLRGSVQGGHSQDSRIGQQLHFVLLENMALPKVFEVQKCHTYVFVVH